MEIKKLEKEYGKPINKITPILEGVSNLSYLINDSDVMRINKGKIDPFYDSGVEKKIIDILKENNYSENVTYFCEETKTKISTFINNTTRLKNPPSSHQLVLVGKEIKTFHDFNIKIGKSFDVFKRLNYYKNNVKERLDEGFEEYIARKAEEIYLRSSTTLCHNDLVKGNILFKKNKVFLIDYEYAGDNSIYFDLGSFLNENDIYSKRKIIKFLRAYFGKNFDLIEYKKVLIFMALNSILWYYWAIYSFYEYKEPIYLDISNIKAKEFALDKKNFHY